MPIASAKTRVRVRAVGVETLRVDSAVTTRKGCAAREGEDSEGVCGVGKRGTGADEASEIGSVP